MPQKPKKQAFSIQGFDLNHIKQTESYVQAIDMLYNSAVNEFAQMASSVKINPDKLFSFSDYPQTRNKAQQIINDLAAKMQAVIKKGSREQWLYACKKNDDFLNYIMNTAKIPASKMKKFQDRNLDALDAFQNRKINGLDLSQRIWNYAGQMKKQMELGIDIALGEGKSAQGLSKDLRQYLVDPDKLFHRVRNKHGQLVLSKNAAAFHPGQGKYRSSYKNAMRLTRSEINMAYRESDQMRWRQLDFIVGYEIKLSNNHTLNGKPFVDICDHLAGKYPKSFVFKGWHPQCYSEDTEVMTEKGWKLFKDLLPDDRIMSLIPETRTTEYVNFVNPISYQFDGEMVRFSNRSLDMLVTPDHRMVYLKKSDGSIAMDKVAAFYSKFNGGLYRSAEHDAEDIPTITIGKHTIEFDLFAQFMAYYLAEGSISWTRKNQLNIAQSKEKHPENYSNIESVLSRLPFKFTPLNERFYMQDPDLCQYLKQFGKSAEKHVPEVIKQASKRQIGLFLDAYVGCDGHSRKNKAFIGNRGNTCESKKLERMFFSSSDQMASDIGELLLKIGKRPSFSIDKVEGIAKEHKNGTYVGNKDLWRIRECHSETATVFNKDLVHYSGMVYDIELERNHIMYVRRNGKCVWGSNCRCYKVPILMSRDEFNTDELNELRAAIKGTEYKAFQSQNTVTDVPQAFKDWTEANLERSKNWKSQPYFIKDNFEGGTLAGTLKVAQTPPMAPKKPIKTEAQKAAIQAKWDERNKQIELTLTKGKTLFQEASQFPEIDSSALQTQIQAKNVKGIEAESKLLQQQIEQAKAEELLLSTLLVDVKGIKAKFGIEATKALYKAVEDKLATWEHLSLADQKKKLSFEVDWVEKNKKYDTWEAAKNAYAKKLSKVEYQLDKETIKSSIKTALDYSTKTKSPKVKQLAAEVQEMIDADAPLSAIKTKAQALNDKVAKLIVDNAAKQAKKRAIKYKGTDADTFSQARKDAAMWAKSGKEADKKVRDVCGDVWKTASQDERTAAYRYTAGSSYINEPLRSMYYSGQYRGVYDGKVDAAHLSNLIEKSSYDFDMWIQRGVDSNGFRGVFSTDLFGLTLEQARAQLVGKVGTEPAFSSCGVSKGAGFSDKTVIYNIYAPRGTKMIYAEPFSAFGHGAKSPHWNGIDKQSSVGYEAEMILQKGTTFRITKIDRSGSRWYIDVEVIAQ